MFVPKPTKSLHRILKVFFPPLLQHFWKVYVSSLLPHFALLLGDCGTLPASRATPGWALGRRVIHSETFCWLGGAQGDGAPLGLRFSCVTGRGRAGPRRPPVEWQGKVPSVMNWEVDLTSLILRHFFMDVISAPTPLFECFYSLLDRWGAWKSRAAQRQDGDLLAALELMVSIICEQNSRGTERGPGGGPCWPRAVCSSVSVSG